LQAGNYAAASAWTQQALAINRTNADFHALAGQLWALQGEFHQAILSWQKARQIDPKHPSAKAYLDALERQSSFGSR
jgi:tetratricopeptide (TPR) repeat protein